MQDYIPRVIDINAQIPPFAVKQYDNNSRKVYLSLIDIDNPNEKTINLDGHKIRAYFKLPDGNVEFIDGEIIDPDDGKIAVTIPSSVTQQIGTVECEVGISSTASDTFLSLRVFKFEVIESIRDDAAIEASPQFSALTNALRTVDGLDARIDNLVAMSDSGEIPTGTIESEVADIRIGADGVTYDSAGTAVRTQFTNLKSDLSYVNNALFSDTYDKRLVTVSAEKNQHNVFVFYLPVDGVYVASNKPFTVYSDKVADGNATVYGYDASGNIIANFQIPFSGGYATINVSMADTVEKLRFMPTDATEASKLYVVANDIGFSKRITDLKVEVTTNGNELASLKSKFDTIKTVETYEEQDSELNQGFWNVNTNTFSSSVSYRTSKPIPCVVGDEFNVNLTEVGPATASIIMFDSEGNYIGYDLRGTSATATFDEITYTVLNANARFISFTFYCSVVQNEQYFYIFKKVQNVMAIAKNQLTGKRLGGLGDSLMSTWYTPSGNEWLSLVGKRNEMTVYNYAISGNPIACVRAEDNNGTEVIGMSGRYQNMIDGLDFIIVMGGANDKNYNVPIGENSDNTVYTFKGALNVLIKGLINKYPQAKIQFCTNYKRFGDSDEKKYVDAMLEVCALHSIPCHNNYISSNCHFDNDGWMDIYGADASNHSNKHLNSLGDERVSWMYEELLKNL